MVLDIHRYVAIGDSFTEGLWDPLPGREDVQRGWADRLAEAISRRRLAAGAAPLQYANHAIRGRLLQPIIDEQLEPALAQHPDLLSIVAGGNDMLRPGSDPDALAAGLEEAVIRARREGVRVLMATGMDPAGLPLVQSVRSKVGTFNAHIWSIAARQGAAVVDLWGLRALRHRQMWAADRIHLSSEGHHRVAQAALRALGWEPEDPAWRTALPPAQIRRAEQLRENGQWLRRDVLPWATRRLRRRSSGDERVAKYPDVDDIP